MDRRRASRAPSRAVVRPYPRRDGARCSWGRRCRSRASSYLFVMIHPRTELRMAENRASLPYAAWRGPCRRGGQRGAVPTGILAAATVPARWTAPREIGLRASFAESATATSRGPLPFGDLRSSHRRDTRHVRRPLARQAISRGPPAPSARCRGHGRCGHDRCWHWPVRALSQGRPGLRRALGESFGNSALADHERGTLVGGGRTCGLRNGRDLMPDTGETVRPVVVAGRLEARCA